MKCKLYYSSVHGKIHLEVQITNWTLLHFLNVPWKAGFFGAQRAKHETSRQTPKLKVRQMSQIGF